LSSVDFVAAGALGVTLGERADEGLEGLLLDCFGRKCINGLGDGRHPGQQFF
jgi:hypothetical protein